MRAWQKLIVSAAVTAGLLVVLVTVSSSAVDLIAAGLLVVAFALLAREAMRFASEPGRRDAPPPRPRS